MGLPDISVDESEQIPQILEPLTAGMQDAVLFPGGSGGGGQQNAAAAVAAVGGVPLEELAAALAERTPAVMKLRVRLRAVHCCVAGSGPCRGCVCRPATVAFPGCCIP